MTPRVVDWLLAALVWALFATGVFALYTGRGDQAWIFGTHAVLAFALGAVLVWKLRRVWRRVVAVDSWDQYTGAGLAALTLVGLALVTGWVWSSGGDVLVAGYNLLSWHFVLGTTLVVLVAGHALVRRKPLRGRDVAAGRRQFFAVAGVALGAAAVWQLQRPFYGLVGWRGAKRRFTGSFDAGDEVPVTSWVADRPRAIDRPSYRLRVDGLVRAPVTLDASSLDAGDTSVATLDCTGGWYSEQRWRGVRLDRLIARAGGAAPGAGHVRVVSYTGYRWSYPLSEAPRLLVATHMGGAPLDHGHGAPARLVAPGRRGFQWVKWIVRIELTEHEDLGAPASTLWSSGTPEGRGEA